MFAGQPPAEIRAKGQRQFLVAVEFAASALLRAARAAREPKVALQLKQKPKPQRLMNPATWLAQASQLPSLARSPLL